MGQPLLCLLSRLLHLALQQLHRLLSLRVVALVATTKTILGSSLTTLCVPPSSFWVV